MAITAISNGEPSDHVGAIAVAPTSKIANEPTRDLEVDTLRASGAVTVTSGGLTVTAGGLTVTAGGLTVTAGGLTVTAGGLTVTAGNVAVTAGNLTFGAASAKIIPGATSLLIRNNADNATNVSITNAGAVAITGALTPTGGVAAAGGFTFLPNLCHTGGIPARVSTDGTDATPAATEVYFAQVTIPANCTVTGVSVFNGSVANGNMKVGLADSTGAILATSASTAMVGTDVYQRVPFTAPYAAKGPATYYVLQFMDGAVARINCHTFGDFIAGKLVGQVYANGFANPIVPGTTFNAGLGPIASLY